MLTALVVLIAIISVLLIIVVLIQNPKGGGIDSTYGGAAANQMFGASRSSDLIEKVTWGLAATLVVLCIVTTLMVGGSGESVTPLLTE